LITVESSEEECEDIMYTHLRDDYTALFESEMVNVIEEKVEESLIFGDVAQGKFLAKLAGKKSIFLLHR
jgi:hypothetical protein